MEIAELVKQWEETSLLEGLDGDRKEGMAACFEVQREFNESDGERCPVSFKRASIPIVRRTFAETKNVFTNHFDDAPGNTNFYIFKTPWNTHSHVTKTEHGDHYDMDAERDYIAEFSKNIKEELDTVFFDTPAHVQFYGLSANDDNNGQVIMFYI